MHLISTIARYFLCLIPYLILVSNSDIIYHITGPITISPFNNKTTNSLIYWIAAMQFVRIFYQYFAKIIISLLKRLNKNNKKKVKAYNPYMMAWNYNQVPDSRDYEIFQKMTVKYAIIILMKLILIFYQIHRMKYYLHVFFLELFIVGVCVLGDVINNPKVSQTLDIIVVDGFNRVAIFYELTRTFNPNFGLYFFGNNLIVLICYQLEGQRNENLYVKHDIYRIMVITMGYLCLFSLLQCSITYRPLIIFGLTFYFFFEAIREFNHSSIVKEKQEIQQKENNKQGQNRRKSLVQRFMKKTKQFKKRLNDNQEDNTQRGLLKYFKNLVQNKPLRQFMIVVVITIVIQLLFIFIFNNSNQQIKLVQNDQTANNFLQYLNNSATSSA